MEIWRKVFNVKVSDHGNLKPNKGWIEQGYHKCYIKESGNSLKIFVHRLAVNGIIKRRFWTHI